MAQGNNDSSHHNTANTLVVLTTHECTKNHRSTKHYGNIAV